MGDRDAPRVTEERRVLVTIHLPIEARCYAAILRAVARSYPDFRSGGE